jgi:peptide chain release factor 1
MLEKLEAIKERFEEIGQSLMQPEITSDVKRFSQMSKEYKDLERIVKKYEEYKKITNDIAGAETLLRTEKDEDLREMAKEELNELVPIKDSIEEELKVLLIPKDPNDSKDAIIEIRAGTGGDEAAIFAGDLWRMYQRFAEAKGWQMQTIDFTEGTAGGYKEIICTVSGEDVYGTLKFESGVHRVQRVPATESQGRIHTSAASVVVLPEAEDVEVEINMNDVRKDTFCSSGAGGQSVNTTYSAVRLTHIPTGIVVSCQDERSQLKNFDKALKVLKARIHDMEVQKHNSQIASARKSMVGSGDRSDKIRTYNYPQSRVTDHRIGLTLYNLPAVMNGDLEEIIEKLKIAERTSEQEPQTVTA